MPTFEKITVSVIVAAPVRKVWNTFTSPDSIVQWNFASADWCCPSASNDLRDDGTFNYRMESKDKKYGFDFCGRYTKVIPERQIDYVLGDDRAVSIEFREKNGQTEVLETFDAEKENSLDLQKSGWQAILENFRKQAEIVS